MLKLTLQKISRKFNYSTTHGYTSIVPLTVDTGRYLYKGSTPTSGNAEDLSNITLVVEQDVKHPL